MDETTAGAIDLDSVAPWVGLPEVPYEGLILLDVGTQRYTRQAGGVRCLHPVETGVLVPLEVPGDVQFTDWCRDVDALEAAIQSWLPGVELDRYAPEGICEAWLRVVLPGGSRAIVTWVNSD